MSIPLTGFIALILILISMFIGRKALIVYVIFFMPFSSVAVVNFNYSENAISYALFFSLTYIFSSLLINFNIVKILKFEFGFFGLSLILYYLISAFFYDDYDSSGYYLNERSIFQLAYFVIGYFLTVAVAIDICRYGHYQLALKTIVWSMLVVSLIGEYQYLSYYFGWYYPSEIFNNSVNPYAQGYTGVLENGMKRISSVSTEPSILSQWLVVCLSILSFHKMYGFKQDFFVNLVMVNSIVVLVLSTSSTAYMGLVIIYSIVFLFGLMKFGCSSRLRFFVFFVFLSFLFILVAFPFIYDAVIFKIGTYSFAERYGSIAFGWEQFVNNPLIGMGLGVVTVHSLPVGLLANTGIIGFSLFTFWVGREIIFSIVHRKEKASIFYSQSVMFSVIVMLALQVLTGFAYVYSFFWILLGLLVGENLYFKLYKAYVIK